MVIILTHKHFTFVLGEELPIDYFHCLDMAFIFCLYAKNVLKEA